jgi:hypothetical protein
MEGREGGRRESACAVWGVGEKGRRRSGSYLSIGCPSVPCRSTRDRSLLRVCVGGGCAGQ